MGEKNSNNSRILSWNRPPYVLVVICLIVVTLLYLHIISQLNGENVDCTQLKHVPVEYHVERGVPAELKGKDPSTCTIGMVGGNPSNNGYGEWPICTNFIPREPTVYSFGIGNDVTFDKAMAEEYGASLFCYDPTVKPDDFASYIRNSPKKSKFTFLQFGLSAVSGVIPFYKSTNPKIESLSMTPGDAYHPDPFLWAPVLDIEGFMRLNQHSFIDILKIDAETAEFDIFQQLDLVNLNVMQVLVEFHARWYPDGWKVQEQIYQRFKDAGWYMAHESKMKEEIVFLRT